MKWSWRFRQGKNLKRRKQADKRMNKFFRFQYQNFNFESVMKLKQFILENF